jgi:hypothetical protein
MMRFRPAFPQIKPAGYSPTRPQLHGWDIHAVTAEPDRDGGQGSPVTGMYRKRKRSRGRARFRA